MVGDEQPTTVFEAVGGETFFLDLVDRFYQGVDGDPTIRPMYPDDLAPSKALLAGFLIQYWGGPTTYSDHRGHPRLRMRHAPFVIDASARDAWLRHMQSALDDSDASDDLKAAMDEYFVRAANHLINAEPPA